MLFTRQKLSIHVQQDNILIVMRKFMTDAQLGFCPPFFSAVRQPNCVQQKCIKFGQFVRVFTNKIFLNLVHNFWSHPHNLRVFFPPPNFIHVFLQRETQEKVLRGKMFFLFTKKPNETPPLFPAYFSTVLWAPRALPPVFFSRRRKNSK